MITEAITKLVAGENLSAQMAEDSVNEIMSGEVDQVLIGAFLTALAEKGATDTEVAACAKGMRKNALPFHHDGEVLEIVGTGGDKSNSFNISTGAALVLAAAGVKVAKHGNRAATSKCGTADCLEALGVNIRLEPEKMEQVLKEVGICFLFAQVYHTSMKYVGPVRAKLPFPTVFNLLGPLTNPAYPTYQLLGVYHEDLVVPQAHILTDLGVKKGMVVYGQDVLDEISISAPTSVCEFDNGEYKEYTITPEQFGLPRGKKEDLVGGEPAENAQILRDLFAGQKGTRRDAVVLNAAAAFHITQGVSMEEGIAKAQEVIDAGLAAAKLDEFVRATNKF